MLVINFTKEFSQQTSEEFFKKYIIDKIGIKEIVIGYDHHFGKGRGGDETTLKDMGKQYGFDVEAVDAFTLNGEIISSTKIRKALSEEMLKTSQNISEEIIQFPEKLLKAINAEETWFSDCKH